MGMFALFFSLTACSEQPEKVTVKPLTKEQVMAKVSQQLKKQTTLTAVQYHRKEKQIHGSTESKIEYYGDKEYYSMLKDDNGYDDQVYQLPEYRYERHIYKKEQKKEWKKIPYKRSFKEVDLGTRTSSGNENDLKAQTYFTVLETTADKVQMKETAASYELSLASTDILSNFKWMQAYLQNFGDVIDPNKIEFTKYQTKIMIDKKTFAVQSIENEVLFTRDTFNLDNGEKGKEDLNIQTEIHFPSTKKLVVPKEVIAEGNKNDPTKAFE
jgi:hypothetical protein